MLSHSDGGGGAGRAARRLFDALGVADVSATMVTDFVHSSEPGIVRPPGPLRDFRRRGRILMEEIPAVLARYPEPRLFSPGIASALSARSINESAADVVNLQWVNFGFLSIRTIGQITKPLTWSMHDMWAFTGGENYTSDSETARWRSGYSHLSIPADERRRFDVERWVWERKVRSWRRPITLIASSMWMANLASNSPLTRKWPTAVIPNALDTHAYSPGSQADARFRIGVRQGVKVIAGILSPGPTQHRKGFDLFVESLELLSGKVGQNISGFEVVIGGMDAPRQCSQLAGFPTKWLGRINDPQSIDLYRAADVMVVPSRQDNSPQTATEAMSCGTPVVAFNTSGLPSFVQHDGNGYLARPFDAADLAHGIHQLLDNDDLRRVYANAARKVAEQEWSLTAVGHSHAELFASAIDDNRGSK